MIDKIIRFRNKNSLNNNYNDYNYVARVSETMAEGGVDCYLLGAAQTFARVVRHLYSAS